MLTDISTDIPKDLIIVREAIELLGVSPTKMAKLLREGVIPCWPNPLDARVKLVSKADVERLIPARISTRAEAA